MRAVAAGKVGCFADLLRAVRSFECRSHPFGELIEAHQQRMQTPEAKQLYRQRKQTVELAFADSKQHRGLRRISGYGLTKARLQTGLTVLVHNLLTLQSALWPTQRNESNNPSGP